MANMDVACASGAPSSRLRFRVGAGSLEAVIAAAAAAAAGVVVVAAAAAAREEGVGRRVAASCARRAFNSARAKACSRVSRAEPLPPAPLLPPPQALPCERGSAAGGGGALPSE